MKLRPVLLLLAMFQLSLSVYGQLVIQSERTRDIRAATTGSQDNDTIPCPIYAGFSIAQWPLCTGCSLQLINATNYAIWYEWFWNGILFNTCKNPSLFLDLAGHYEIMLVASDQICSDTAIMFIEVFDAYHGYDSARVCHGEIFQYHGYHFDQTGVYQVKLNSVNGCDSMITLSLWVDTLEASFTQSGGIASAPPGYAVYQWLRCDQEFAMIAGAAGSVFQPAQPGFYTVAISSPECSDTADCQYFSLTGIEAPGHGEKISIYPVPAREQLSVAGLENGCGYLASILSREGQLLYTVQINREMNIISLPKLPSGTYMLRLTSPGQATIHRFFNVE